MSKITFEEYLEDVLDLNIGLMADNEIAKARESYEKYTESSSACLRKKLSKEAQNAKSTAKFFGGKALRGSAKQKEWAEKIRAEKLLKMSFEKATELMSYEGFINHAKFWIENRGVDAFKFDTATIVTEVEKIMAVEAKNWDVLNRTCETYKKNAARAEIDALRKNCVFTYADNVTKIVKRCVAEVLKPEEENNDDTLCDKIKARTGVKSFQQAFCQLERVIDGLLNNQRHPAVELENVIVDGVTAHVFMIPSLEKNAVAFEVDGKVFQGFTK